MVSPAFSSALNMASGVSNFDCAAVVGAAAFFAAGDTVEDASCAMTFGAVATDVVVAAAHATTPHATHAHTTALITISPDQQCPNQTRASQAWNPLDDWSANEA